MLGRGARSFLEAYRPRPFLVATLGFEHTTGIAGRPVEWLHVADVLGRVREILGLE